MLFPLNLVARPAVTIKILSDKGGGGVWDSFKNGWLADGLVRGWVVHLTPKYHFLIRFIKTLR